MDARQDGTVLSTARSHLVILMKAFQGARGPRLRHGALDPPERHEKGRSGGGRRRNGSSQSCLTQAQRMKQSKNKYRQKNK